MSYFLVEGEPEDRLVVARNGVTTERRRYRIPASEAVRGRATSQLSIKIENHLQIFIDYTAILVQINRRYTLWHYGE